MKPCQNQKCRALIVILSKCYQSFSIYQFQKKTAYLLIIITISGLWNSSSIYAVQKLDFHNRNVIFYGLQVKWSGQPILISATPVSGTPLVSIQHIMYYKPPYCVVWCLGFKAKSSLNLMQFSLRMPRRYVQSLCIIIIPLLT